MSKAEGIIEEITRALKHPYFWKNMAAVAAIASFLLPWVYFDGSRDSQNGAELIVHMLRGQERGTMLGNSFLGATVLIVVPFITLIACGAGMCRTWQNLDTLPYGAVAALLPLSIVLFSGPVTSSEHLLGNGMMIPQPGIVAIFMLHVGLVGWQLWERADRKPEEGTEGTPQQGQENREVEPVESGAPSTRHRNDRRQDASWEREENRGYIGTIASEEPPEREPRTTPRRNRDWMKPKR